MSDIANADPAASMPTRTGAERFVEAFQGLRARSWILLLPAAMAFLILAMAAVALADGSPSAPGQAYHHGSDRNQCENDARNAAGGYDPVPRHEADAPDDRGQKAYEENASLRIARLTLRQSMYANCLAAEYNVISADAAFWARVSGAVVVTLSVVSVLGVVIALFAASDARRAIDVNLLSAAAARQSSRAYIRLVPAECAGVAAAISNEGNSPAAVTAMFTASLAGDYACLDPSVFDWHRRAVLADLVGSRQQRPIDLPELDGIGPFGLLIGVDFTDIHGDRWRSWRHCYKDKSTGKITLGGAGEFPLH